LGGVRFPDVALNSTSYAGPNFRFISFWRLSFCASLVWCRIFVECSDQRARDGFWVWSLVLITLCKYLELLRKCNIDYCTNLKPWICRHHMYAAGLFATFSKKRFMLPVPFSPFRRNSGTGFDPYAETPREGRPPRSPQGNAPSGAGHQDDAPHLEPPEPPQLVLPSLARRLSSIVKQEASPLQYPFMPLEFEC